VVSEAHQLAIIYYSNSILCSPYKLLYSLLFISILFLKHIRERCFSSINDITTSCLIRIMFNSGGSTNLLNHTNALKVIWHYINHLYT